VAGLLTGGFSAIGLRFFYLNGGENLMCSLPLTERSFPMDDRELRSYEMVLRVRDLGLEYADSFPSKSLGSELFATLGAAATELAEHVAASVSGSTSARQGTASKAVAREALRESLESIRNTARSMSITMPGLDSKFRIPRKLTDQQLLGTARAFATDAAPLKKDFLRFALPLDFLEELDTHINEFETALNSQQTSMGHQVAATAGIDDALERALSAVRQLDAIVPNTFRNDPLKIAAWHRARHVQRAPHPKKKTTPPASQEKP
jgi:hypothetical protein